VRATLELICGQLALQVDALPATAVSAAQDVPHTQSSAGGCAVRVNRV
jgi:hypothetical protein